MQVFTLQLNDKGSICLRDGDSLDVAAGRIEASGKPAVFSTGPLYPGPGFIRGGGRVEISSGDLHKGTAYVIGIDGTTHEFAMEYIGDGKLIHAKYEV